MRGTSADSRCARKLQTRVCRSGLCQPGYEKGEPRPSKDEVDATIAQGVAAGGKADPNPGQDLGFMYNRHIEDPDGNVWEFIC